jgi:purine-binding chemotaxis protein CheW
MESGQPQGICQYLTFRLDSELFAIDIARVREVLEFSSATKVPCTPDYMRGVINLRGNVVPVVDMRIKLGMPTTAQTVDTCVIITEVGIDGGKVVVGALVDSVQEVLDIDSANILPPPQMGSRVDASVLHGMGRRDDEFVIILNLDMVFPQEDLRLTVAAA